MVLGGKSSTSSPVSSGVPKGTVIGQLLFLVFINDLPNKVRSTTDDCQKSEEDITALQEDLDQLQQWKKDSQMKLNPDKCEVIRITKKRKVIRNTYTVHGQTLQQTNKAKTLGVNLSWNPHVAAAGRRPTALFHSLEETCRHALKE